MSLTTFYYIFGVRYERKEDLTSELSLDFMIEYTDREMENSNLAQEMIKNEMNYTSKKEAIEACNLNKLNIELFAASHMIRSNNLTAHKVESSIRLTREDLHMYVDACNYSKESLKELKEGQIKL